MTDDNDEIQYITRELQSLQLRQTELLARLERVSRNERTTNRTNRANEHATETEEVQEFTIGDKVRIKNPRPLQENQGIIVKITESRITIKPKKGINIVRAPKNVIKTK
jgi:ribosomal protein S17